MILSRTFSMIYSWILIPPTLRRPRVRSRKKLFQNRMTMQSIPLFKKIHYLNQIWKLQMLVVREQFKKHHRQETQSTKFLRLESPSSETQSPKFVRLESPESSEPIITLPPRPPLGLKRANSTPPIQETRRRTGTLAKDPIPKHASCIKQSEHLGLRPLVGIKRIIFDKIERHSRVKLRFRVTSTE
uniref:Uncharacterized protein n=1 Tax=Lygus hesperus TaxID=30085 RepID=A0A0K8SYG7_LYGHE